MSERADPKIKDLLEANCLLRSVRATSSSLWLRRLTLETATWVAFSDAGWANAEDMRSQKGQLIPIANAEGEAASLAEWRSHRIKRMCRSTLAAETQSLSTAVDTTLFLRALIAEMLVPVYFASKYDMTEASFRPRHFVASSPYDILIKETSLANLAEKQTVIDLAWTQDLISELDLEGPRDRVYWADTAAQPADLLTKARPHGELCKILRAGWIRIARHADEAA